MRIPVWLSGLHRQKAPPWRYKMCSDDDDDEEDDEEEVDGGDDLQSGTNHTPRLRRNTFTFFGSVGNHDGTAESATKRRASTLRGRCLAAVRNTPTAAPNDVVQLERRWKLKTSRDVGNQSNGTIDCTAPAGRRRRNDGAPNRSKPDFIGESSARECK